MIETISSPSGDRTVGLDGEPLTRECLVPHLRWELQEVMSRVEPDDLSAAEITALLDILGPAHSRVIGGPAGRPRLRLRGIRSDYPAPKLA